MGYKNFELFKNKMELINILKLNKMKTISSSIFAVFQTALFFVTKQIWSTINRFKSMVSNIGMSIFLNLMKLPCWMSLQLVHYTQSTKRMTFIYLPIHNISSKYIHFHRIGLIWTSMYHLVTAFLLLHFMWCPVQSLCLAETPYWNHSRDEWRTIICCVI